MTMADRASPLRRRFVSWKNFAPSRKVRTTENRRISEATEIGASGHATPLKESGVQFIWQTGKYYNAAIMEQLKGKELPMLKVTDFISDMGAAYKAADLVISRAGASRSR